MEHDYEIVVNLKDMAEAIQKISQMLDRTQDHLMELHREIEEIRQAQDVMAGKPSQPPA